ncbi:hypothetical protein JL193_11210 [Polaribacter batillariae]|uniref:Uncharacterized protein n=1 Tax=Polaribacter batillariae TaxID=2808900 RepID=A0ABX7STM7_9FLAO|nr:hypothetical protein [Polaribacter batillariae]QTD36705.1 hypothetical protein JL193_11210 [Polaribacter batillariae]
MKLISEHITSLICILGITIFIIVYLIYQYKQLKIKEINKLNYLFLDFKEEKIISNQLRKLPTELKTLEQNTQQKLQKIKVDVLNINFSLVEIFK